MVAKVLWPARFPSIFMRSSSAAVAEEQEQPELETENAGLPAGGTMPLLELTGITKAFPGVVANDHINLQVFGGQVHAVLGENGAGKSTLMKIIYGFYQQDSGSIAFNGQETRMQSPNDSRRLGIGMVFQNFALIPALSVLENVSLFLPSQGKLLIRRTLRRKIFAVSDKYDLQVNPDARVGDLSLGERQKVELIKLLLADARVLIFDEPTSVLAPHEVDGLFRVFAELKRDGYAILFITHKMREVLSSADTVTVLRQGRVVSTLPCGDVDSDMLVSMMLGEETPEAVRNTAQPAAVAGHESQVALEFRDIWTVQEEDPRGLRGISFTVNRGEILGVAGVSGNGQHELGEVLLGLMRKRGGSVHLFGEDIGGRTVSNILGSGVGYIPEDALAMAMVPEMRVEENLVLGELHRYGSGGFWLDRSGIRDNLAVHLADFPLALANQESRVDELSGGNVQRVLLAREMTRDPKVLMAYYPTRGLDVLTTESTRRLLMDCRDNGGAVVLVSEDLDELLALSDRLVVMYQGEIVGEFRPETAEVREIGLLMTGHHK